MYKPSEQLSTAALLIAEDNGICHFHMGEMCSVTL
jgi:hypothetical protein